MTPGMSCRGAPSPWGQFVG